MIDPNAPLSEAPPAGFDAQSTGTFGIRVAGRIIDLVFSFVLGAAGGVIGGIIAAILAAVGKIDSGWVQRMGQSAFLHDVAWGLLAGILYETVAEGVGGASLGKLVLGYRVVHTNLQPCSVSGAFKRSLAYLWDAFFFGMPAYSSMQNGPFNQRYGDKWARTMVAKRAALPATAVRAPALTFLGLACGCTAYALVMTVSVLQKVM